MIIYWKDYSSTSTTALCAVNILTHLMTNSHRMSLFKYRDNWLLDN